MKLKLISAVAALALLSGPAFALTDDLGTLTSGYSNAFGGGSVSSPDAFEFATTGAEYLQLSATVANTSINLGGMDLALTGPTNESAAFTKTIAWNAEIGGAYPGVELLAGAYRFTLDPAASGESAAVGYSINLTSVPEISTWAMMLAGFSCLGLAGRRRRTSSVPDRASSVQLA